MTIPLRLSVVGEIGDGCQSILGSRVWTATDPSYFRYVEFVTTNGVSYFDIDGGLNAEDSLGDFLGVTIMDGVANADFLRVLMRAVSTPGAMG
jgi:hypothetical protein